MKRRLLLPFPWLALALFALWLLLNESLGLGQIALGAALAVGGVWAVAQLEPPRLRLRRPRLIGALFFLVLADIVRSNIAVARIILGGRHRNQTSGFMTIPLELRAPYGLATLALIITSTPGTLWVNFDAAKGLLTIHVLDLIDENAWIATIKDRYERRLLEIFE